MLLLPLAGLILIGEWRLLDQVMVERRPLPHLPEQTPDPRPLPRLPHSTPHDREIRVKLGAKRSSTGTAFSMHDSGVWLTARHVVDKCTNLRLDLVHRQIAIRRVITHSNADLALLLTPRAPARFELSQAPLHIGQHGFHVGFPRGEPGQVWSSLLGRRRMRIRGRYRTNEPVVAWAERRRWPDHLTGLGGLSGGPTFDAKGEVVGVLVATSRRRGRLYSAAPSSLRQVMRGAGINQPKMADRGSTIAPNNLPQVARHLRRGARVARVLCYAR